MQIDAYWERLFAFFLHGYNVPLLNTDIEQYAISAFLIKTYKLFLIRIEAQPIPSNIFVKGSKM